MGRRKCRNEDTKMENGKGKKNKYENKTGGK
jgi:hypothetical protein